MRATSLLYAPAVMIVSAVLCTGSFAQAAGDTASFNLADKTAVPGATLKPGDYTIKIVDHLTDRNIIRIDSKTGQEHAIFLGVIKPNTNQTGATVGVIPWNAKINGTSALRGFLFAGDAEVEFIYPKTEAVALAKANSARVIAIDPQSEGRPTLKNLSKDDMQVVTLWMLSLTTTGSKEKTPAIAAQRYQESTSAVAAVTSPVVPVITPDAQQRTQVAALDRPQPPTTDRVSTSAKRKPVVATLPKTGSQLPLVGLVAFLSMCGAAGMWTKRTTNIGTL